MGYSQGSSKRQVYSRYMKRCSMSLIIWETQIKTTMRFHLTPVRMATIKKTKDVLVRIGEKGTITVYC